MTEKMKPTVVTLVLDESGSMNMIKDDTIGGYNAYLKTLQEGSDQTVTFSLIKFDSNGIRKPHVAQPVEEIPELDGDSYRPGASTPLIDAAYKSIVATQAHVEERNDDPNVVVVIQTDGHENASVEYDNKDVAKLIAELTLKGWVFVFLGANIDAFDQAREWGVNRGTTLAYGLAQTRSTFDTVAAKTRAYGITGQSASMNFTEEERAELKPDETTEAPKKREGLIQDFQL